MLLVVMIVAVLVVVVVVVLLRMVMIMPAEKSRRTSRLHSSTSFQCTQLSLSSLRVICCLALVVCKLEAHPHMIWL